MKYLLVFLLLLCGCGSDSTPEEIQAAVDQIAPDSAQTERCEIPVERDWANPYTGQGSYSIGLCGGVIEVTLTLCLVEEEKGTITDGLLMRYEDGIEAAWDTDRFDVPIRVNVVWSCEEPDKEITVRKGLGRFNTSQWYTTGWIEHGAAHECGHYLGLYDEYGGGGDAQGFDGGAAPGPRGAHGPGLMANSNYPTLDYYYDHFRLWYEERTKED